MAALKAGKSIKAVSDIILTDFEKPADQSTSVKSRRANIGKEIYDRQASGNTAKTQEAAKKVYLLQFGAYSKQENARKRTGELRKRGIEAEAEKIGSFWKVRSKDSYNTAAEAASARSRMSAKKINSVVVEV